MIERAEFPVQRKRTLNGFLSGRSLMFYVLCILCLALAAFRCGPAAIGLAHSILKIANLGMTIATIGDQESNQSTHAFDVGAVDDRPAVARATNQAGASQARRLPCTRVAALAPEDGDALAHDLIWLG